jgi:hypothetical protein
MFNADDYTSFPRKDKKGNVKLYRCYCDNCGTDRGYHYKALHKRLCKSCAGKISHANVSVETRRKMSAAKKNCVPHNKGKNGVSEATSKKMSAAKKGKPANNKGKANSIESKIKLSCALQGIELHEFNGFKTSLNKKERIRFYEKQLHNRCFERDNFTCDICKAKGAHLNAHHLNSFAHFPQQRFELCNLITLCKRCHVDFHAVYGNGKMAPNTKEQYAEFKALKLVK